MQNLKNEALKLARDSAVQELNELKAKKSRLGLFDVVEKLKLTAAIALAETKLNEINKRLASVDASDSAYSSAPVNSSGSSVSSVKNYKDAPDSVSALVPVFEDYFSEEFPDYTIETNVRPERFGAEPLCKPVQFLFSQNGTPVLAVAIVTQRGYTHGAVTGTKYAILGNRIKYVHFYAEKPNERSYVVNKVRENL